VSDFWAKKLGTQIQQPAPQTRQDNMPVAPSQMPMQQMPQPAQQPVLRLPSSTQTGSCPDCGSINYMSVQGAKARCMDCGYPIEQSGSKYGSLAGAHIEGSAKEARGNDTTNNYNPQNIIGRVN